MNKYNYFIIQPGDTETTLKKQYRDLLKEHHPDKPEGSEDAAKKINWEYAQLKKLIIPGSTINYAAFLAENAAFSAADYYELFIKPTYEPIFKIGLLAKMDQIVNKLPPDIREYIKALKEKSGFDQYIMQFDPAEKLKNFDVDKARANIDKTKAFFKQPKDTDENNEGI